MTGSALGIAPAKIVEALVDGVLNKGRRHLVDDLVDPRYVDHDPVEGIPSGIFGLKLLCDLFRQPGTDVHFITPLVVGHQDLVAVRLFGEGCAARRLDQYDNGWAVTMPSQSGLGDLRGARQVHMVVRSVSLFRLRAERISDRWGPIRIEWSTWSTC